MAGRKAYETSSEGLTRNDEVGYRTPGREV